MTAVNPPQTGDARVEACDREDIPTRQRLSRVIDTAHDIEDLLDILLARVRGPVPPEPHVAAESMAASTLDNDLCGLEVTSYEIRSKLQQLSRELIG